MNNVGKLFELQLKKSVPPYALFYRLSDSAQSFGESNTLRFSNKNPFDFLLWDSNGKRLFALEAKTVKDKSISFERTKTDKGIIHYHQIKGLNEWSKYDGIVAGFIIEFRILEKTIFININDFYKLIMAITKKSFTLKDLDDNNISYFVIPQAKKRTRFTYDLDYFITETRK